MRRARLAAGGADWNLNLWDIRTKDAAAVLAGCLSRPPLDRTTYVLTATREAPAAPVTKPVAVKVRPMRAEPLYERREFLYRVDGEQVKSDFYNEFAETPESMLTAAVICWLKNARL